MNERRRVRRTAIFKGAKITFNASLHDCVVKDISPLGARLALISTAFVPDTFDLTFDSAHTLRKCRMIWHSDTQIGVEFQGASFRPGP